MIQLNLLPDVKQEYIKTQRTKRLVIGVSFILSAVALFVFLVLIFSVYIVQKASINGLTNNIQTDSNTLKQTPNISKILTVQSQLDSLSTLHGQTPAPSRLFGYLSQLTPNQATISSIQTNYSQNTMMITGNAPSLVVVNTFVDSLKYTTYTVSGESGLGNAFSAVVLSNFSYNSTSASSASYTITFSFNPIIFNNADSVTLNVGGNPPSSASQQPSIIFEKGN